MARMKATRNALEDQFQVLPLHKASPEPLHLHHISCVLWASLHTQRHLLISCMSLPRVRSEIFHIPSTGLQTAYSRGVFPSCTPASASTGLSLGQLLKICARAYVEDGYIPHTASSPCDLHGLLLTTASHRVSIKNIISKLHFRKCGY